MSHFFDLFYDEVIVDIVDNAHLLLRLLIACLCGAFIGFERSRRQKDAGIRTHMIVALGAALAMVVSKYGFFDLAQYGEFLKADASRIASNVITGVGFLGAGVIFVRDNAGNCGGNLDYGERRACDWFGNVYHRNRRNDSDDCVPAFLPQVLYSP